MNARVRVEIIFDPESANWSFRVPSLGIVGGAETREAAEAEALEAIVFSLEADDAPGPEGAEVEYVEVTLGRGVA